jgi:glycosyltransferase involved in cell wall biosynthesis
LVKGHEPANPLNQYVRDLSILHLGKFYPPHHGGMETHVRDLAVRQAQLARVKVIVSNNVLRSERSMTDGVDVMRVARLGTIASMPICPGLTQLIRNSPADLVHLHVPNPGAAFSFLTSGHHGKLVITHHADTLGRKALRWMSDVFVRKAMERAAAIIVTSERYFKSSVELAPFREKCRVIPLGIDLSQAAEDDDATVGKLRAEFGEPLVLAIGRLVPYKGFDILIRAMKSVDAKLLVIGTGPKSAELQALIDNSGIQDRVKMIGRVDDLSPYFRAASLFVMSSTTRAEAFGIAQLEAMAAGLPVINTDIDSGVPEVSIDQETGITVPAGDVNLLAEAIELLLMRADLRAKYGRSARERVNTEFTVDLMVKRTLSLYEEILDRK